MGIGVSLLLVAIGAILIWAVDVIGQRPRAAVTIGWILLVVGAIGAACSRSSSGRAGADSARRTDREDEVVYR